MIQSLGGEMIGQGNTTMQQDKNALHNVTLL